jgi:O-antigen ligase
VKLDKLHWAIIATILAYLWRIHDLFGPLRAIKFSWLAFLAAIALFVMGGAKVKSSVFKQPVTRYLLFIIGWMFLSVPGSLFPGLSASFILNQHLHHFALFLLITFAVRSFDEVEKFALANLVGAAIYCVFILTTFQVGANGRLGELPYYDSNDLAMLIVAMLPFVVYFGMTAESKTLRLASLAVGPVFIVAIIRTGSRGGFLGLIGVGLFMLFGFSQVPRRIRVATVAAATVGLIVIGGPSYWESMATLLNPKADYNWSGESESGRMEVWKRGIGYMNDRPILGVGVNAFPVAEGTISPLADRQALGFGLKWSAAHNSFVEIGSELGYPGLIGFVLLLVAGFKSLRQKSRGRPPRPGSEQYRRAVLAQTLSASLVGYIVAAFFLSQAYAALLFVSMGLIVALSTVPAPGHPLNSRRGPVPPRRGSLARSRVPIQGR